ncbi:MULTISPECIES: PEP-CTERM sorting domain-containing protein [Calothrix]|uniref:PEP-CTERM sorting domain-containing protein n=2 Tax=Calothrix TaxID=1186 RepID=A0ABR8AH57_9CYAN|nr:MULTISPECIES: PEP-CTERM sorting domain-containing protein [Calothrix]MBD2198638.1 PEP-CTERM sorting domain-containing protein [Calothrix parietina FACHB-288]MBD2227041.1 PEP-CTERM sorting domain-containing protein [Calothrix anomala FACHB-343]
MKATTIGSLISSTLGGFLLSLSPASAVTLVEPIVTTPITNFPDGIKVTDALKPSELRFWNAPDTTGEQNFVNDTGFTINQFSFLVFPDFDTLADDVIWGDVDGDGKVGFSNIFSNITISPDFLVENFRAPRLNMTGGSIFNGNSFAVQFITKPDLRPAQPGDNGPLVIGGAYDIAKQVPEPSTILSTALVFGLGSCLRKYKSAR